MSQVSENKKRIAKNTLLLYLRQFLIMLVSLYTSRVVLNVLGVEDFGIYNVVGGIVVMFSFITGTMAASSQRFLSYDLAKDDSERLRQTFSLIMLSYLILIVITVILCESIAVCFLNTQMNIPTERLDAANWVLQCSILSFVANIISAPYMAVVISRERMGVYAYASIVEAGLKLGLVYILSALSFDKLESYAILMFFSTFIIALFYRAYCKRHFAESHYRFFYDRQRLKELSAFAMWNVIGAFSNVLRSQGINILLNLFFSPAVNAARGIAYQINSAMTNFTNNFYTAVRPQIIKSYAQNRLAEMHHLIYFSSRFAYYLLFVLSLPILLITQPILVLWLGTPPEYTALFVRLVIVNLLLEVLNYPLVNGLQAAGKIKFYQIVVSSIYLLNLPISYVLLKFGYPPESTMYVNIMLVSVAFVPRLLLCRKHIFLPIGDYMKKVVLRLLLVSVGITLASLAIAHFYPQSGICSLILLVCIIVLLSSVCIYSFGLEKNERVKIKQVIINKLHNRYVRKRSNRWD